jgi:hypothetical protein
MERNPSEGQAAMNYISTGRQRWAAQAAQIELDARRLERCHTVEEIAQMHSALGAGVLEGPAGALLRSFSKRSEDVAAGLAQAGIFNRRLVLRDVEEALDSVLRELTRSSDPYAGRFRPIAIQWQQIIAGHTAELARLAEERQEIQNPYIVGVPLTRRQQIFVGRIDVSARIESLLQDQHHPPLLLYGQRRMGKTSLLYNLRWMLPTRIVPLLVDLQGPVAQASDHLGLLYALAKGMSVSANQQELALPSLTRTSLASDPFVIFDDWLDNVEQALIASGRDTILLALDEFEALDRAINEKRFSEEAVLGTLRHIIQHRPRFKLLLAGSHTLNEFRRWSSYLINAQMLHISYLHESEARQLIERPVDNFALSYATDASQHVLDLTRGHPYLVQLLCSEIVTLKNEQAPDLRLWATRTDVERAVPEVLVRGHQFFADIEVNQVDEAGLAVLRFIAQQGEGQRRSDHTLRRQFAQRIALESTLTLLIRRELIEEVDSEYCFQVELIRRWFAR